MISKRWLVGLSLAIAMLPRSTSASESVSLDGAWWQSLSRDEQLVAVQGMLSGYFAGYASHSVLLMKSAKPEEVSQMMKFSERLPDVDREMGTGITFGTIVNRINAVYTNHPEMIHEQVTDYVQCAATLRLNCEDTVRLTKHLQTDPFSKVEGSSPAPGYTIDPQSQR